MVFPFSLLGLCKELAKIISLPLGKSINFLPSPSLNENWDGTSWTEVAEVNTGRGQVAARGGTSTYGILASGYTTTYVANTELWNGTAWTEIADVATARYGVGGQGSSTATIAFGGNTSASDPAGVTTTEEFTVPLSNKSISAS